MRIAVIGMGKIELPLAVHYARGGHTVVGVDMNPGVVTLINEGVEPFPDGAHLTEYLPPLTSSDVLRVTTEYAEAIPGADTIVMAAPLIVGNESRPNFRVMDGATRSMAAHLAPGTLVSYETTLPVGTAHGRYRPLIEEASGLIEGCDSNVVLSPERVLTSRVFADLARYPKLMGGLSEVDEARGVSLYEAVLFFDERDNLPRLSGV